MPAFVQTLRMVHAQAKKWGLNVVEVVHDRTSEFEKLFRETHQLFSGIDAAPVSFGIGEEHVLQALPGSKLRSSASHLSAGIQLIDCALWAMKRHMEGAESSPGAAALLDVVARRGSIEDISFRTVGAAVDAQLRQLFDSTLTSKQMKQAEKLRDRLDEIRQSKMDEYAARKRKPEI